jgi:hypothetical protein
MSNEKDNKVICPCCKEERRIKHDTHLIQLEEALLNQRLYLIKYKPFYKTILSLTFPN